MAERELRESISAFDISARVYKALANAVLDAGGTMDDLRRIETDGELRGKVGKLIVGQKPAFLYDKTKEGWTLISDVGFQSGEIELVEFLKPGEDQVDGTVMADRAKELNANLGQKYAEWMLEHQDRIPAKFRQFYLSFPGTVWRGSGGDRIVPFLYWDGDQWYLSFSWRDWYSDDRLLRLRK